MDGKLVVRKFLPSDVSQLMKWGKYEDKRFLHYNYPYTTTWEHTLWYRAKHRLIRRKMFAVDLDGQVIGYVTLKKINWFKQEGEMGISFDRNFTDKGYGTEAIRQFLALVFTRYHMRRVWLRAACFNHRAIRCYEKAGFDVIHRVIEPFEEQSNSFNMLVEFEDFHMAQRLLCTEYVHMEVHRDQFFNQA